MQQQAVAGAPNKMVEEINDTSRVDLSDAVHRHAFIMRVVVSGLFWSGKINTNRQLESCWEIKFPMVHALI